MATLDILTYPNPILRHKSTAVEEFDSDLKETVANMLETMYAAPGIGLAAIQVGIKKRIIVIDIEYEFDDETNEITNKNPRVFINPEIVSKEGEILYQEGCLSVPQFYEEVKRAGKVCVEYFDVEGKKHSIEAEGLLAVALQHEIDHLEGRLFIERLSFIKAKQAKKKLKKQSIDE